MACAKCVDGKHGHQVSNYTIEYHDGHGKKYRETVRTTDKAVAKALLAERVQQAGKNIQAPRAERIMYRDLPPLILADYARNERRATARVECALVHLTYFDRFAANAITASRLIEYIAARRAAKSPSNATINFELVILRRMYKLAMTQLRFPAEMAPIIELLPAPRARQGYFRRDEIERFIAKLPTPIQPVIWFAYFTGWRMYREVLTREWRHVDFAGGWIHIHDGEAKVRGGKRFKLFPELRRLLEAQRAYTDAVERRRGAIVPYVFHRAGKPIVVFKMAWQRALEATGIGPKLRHDLRRTAVINLTNWNVPLPEILSMVGMTLETYVRYKISDKHTQERAAEKIQEAFDAERVSPQMVLPFSGASKEFA